MLKHVKKIIGYVVDTLIVVSGLAIVLGGFYSFYIVMWCLLG